ncbi:hypothetical protein PX554_09335 [Sphingomonas sp. H39-1-10]|uniref:hypothetical protein n=1 Tax=Sphingomonas pollutisoli TaxID=3030829 RepID=UPI0023B8B38E|nr:hypothetical protein [Sphingomonas pollutisoli]MDF0488332.1 hypothetical protein [Sphingomonas pollutisoli]
MRDRMGALAAFLVTAGAVSFGLYSCTHPLPPLGQNFADGSYRSSECGTLTLRKGSAKFGQQTVTYEIERRKGDIAIITPHLLGVVEDSSGCHVVYDASSFPLYISLGRNNPPAAIILPGISNQFVYKFVRQ